MSENKFIAKLKGEPTPKSVVEIQNDRLVAPFKSSPMGYMADRDSSVVVAKGAQNWAVNQGQLVPVTDDYIGTESDLSGTSRVSGAGLWLNATYTFPATGDETNPVSAIIAPSAKWVLTLCGDSLITQNGSVITLTMLVKIGATHLTTKQFKIRECASQFSQRLAIDFSESEQKVIKAHGGSPLTVQVLCDDEGASATIYSGMTHLTLLQRKIDAELVATDNVLLPEFIENLLEGYIIPADYFSRYDYIEQVEDGGKAMPEFTRNGDSMDFTGWAKPVEEVYTKTEIDDKFTAANAQIEANATAIQKTREDFAAADTELQNQITAHTGEISTLRNDIDGIGDQVSAIEEKIPETASAENPLVTRSEISSVYKFKGSVATYNDLPTGATVGDVYNVTDTGANYAWDGSAWDKLSETVDLSSYATTAYVNAREQDIRADYIQADSELQQQINAHATAISTNTSNITALTTRVGTNETNIALLDSDVGTINTDVATAKTDIANLKSSVNSQAGLIQGLQDDVSGKVDKNQGTVNAGKILSVGSDGQVTLTSAPGGGLTAVSHDSTLTGAGTDESPLGIASTVLAEIADKAEQTTVETLSGVVSQNTTNIGTLRTDVDDLGDQVSGIEGKIPESTSATNQLVNATQLSEAIAEFEALPDQTGNAGKVLTTDGTTASWQEPAGGTKVIFREWEE